MTEQHNCQEIDIPLQIVLTSEEKKGTHRRKEYEQRRKEKTDKEVVEGT
jgi:hypothetical protein